VHELAIAESVVESVLARTGDQRVPTVRVRIGRLAGVVRDAFEFSFELATAGTPLEGAALEIEEPEGRLLCRRCGDESPRDDLILLCECGSADVEVVSGRELEIVSVRAGEGVA
jgi:hydrogenase nickel incorporation protein HypA/HybF